MKKNYHFLILALWFSQNPLFAQQRKFDLSSLAQQGTLQMQNRKISPIPAEKGIRLNSAAGDGVAWLEGVEFGNGVVELDIRGKDLNGQSFVGLAFHGTNDSYEAVYFRPFNFQSADSLHQLHMVQYISAPDFGWEILRRDHPGVYEKPIRPAPLPSNWIHAKIVVHYPQVSVFVNNQSTPCITVTELGNRKKGRIGLWVGNNSDGDFANLVVQDE